MAVAHFIHARDRMIAAIAKELSVTDVLTEIAGALHEVAVFDQWLLALTDPDTLLPAGGAVEGFGSESCTPFWDNELLDPDYSKYTALARSSDPVATLFEATDGDLGRSPRYRKLLEPLGTTDELRAAFVTGTSCWAAATLVRSTSGGTFSSSEIQAVRDLLPVASRALRHAVTRRRIAEQLAGPAILVLAPDGTIESMTPDAEPVLFDLRTFGLDDSVVPTAILAAAVRAKSNRSSTRIAVRARGESGNWLKVHASPLGTDGRVAVVIESAGSNDLVPILLESYGLTERETEVVMLIARGLATKEIARELCISAHTVNDHIKVIFTKTGAASRGELVANIFSNHLHAPHHASTIHVG
ncbi:MAG TPA: helix-turn-helix transcriptional regulator [Ilumatobacteraceae bacterium]|nr:helix-turn-helix transcriptional regulator [Ilumatobacteraceae bacterium]